MLHIFTQIPALGMLSQLPNLNVSGIGSAQFTCLHLFNIPSLILVVPNIRHRRVRTILHLRNRLSIPQKREHIIRVLVLDFKMLVPRPLQEFQMMQHTARPDVDSAIRGILFVPGLAILSPDRVFGVPCILVRVQLVGDFLFRVHGLDLIFLHLAAALKHVFDLSVVGGKGAALAPVASGAVGDEVITVLISALCSTTARLVEPYGKLG